MPLGAVSRCHTLRVSDNYQPGEVVAGTVTAHHPWGLLLVLADGGEATVDLRFIHIDVLIWGDPARWPPTGTRVTGRVQGRMPNGQLRVSLASEA